MKILGWIIATPFILLGLFILLRFLSCSPNREVVKVASPVVNQIADYIVKNGIPESLEDIPNIPYKLNKCSKKEVYYIYTEEVQKELATSMGVYLNCYFMENEKLYRIYLDFGKAKNNNWQLSGEVDIYNDASYTGVGTSLNTKKNGTLYKEYSPSGYSHHNNGICSSFKQ